MTINSIITEHYREDEYPVCLSQAKAWGASRPLEGMTILDATPIYRNTLVKHKALLDSGAKLIVGRTSLIQGDDKIVKLLKDNEIKIVDSKEQQTDEIDFILDCAAAFSHWTPKIGYVELTRSGVEKYKNKNLPVFVADSGRIKRIETSLGTGESYFRALKQLGHTIPEGSRIVIFGSGKVGSGLLTYSVKYGLNPIVITELSSVTEVVQRLASDIIDHRDVEKVAEAISGAHAVVTATGIKGAASHPCITEALLNSSALRANMGVEDEYGPALPRERALRNKMPLNFILEEPTHLKYIDATMGLHNEGIFHILEHPEAKGMIDPPSELEERLLGITRKYGCIDCEI